MSLRSRSSHTTVLISLSHLQRQGVSDLAATLINTLSFTLIKVPYLNEHDVCIVGGFVVLWVRYQGVWRAVLFRALIHAQRIISSYDPHVPRPADSTQTVWSGERGQFPLSGSCSVK